VAIVGELCSLFDIFDTFFCDSVVRAPFVV
jgi:hypothetical protein